MTIETLLAKWRAAKGSPEMAEFFAKRIVHKLRHPKYEKVKNQILQELQGGVASGKKSKR